MKLGPKLTVAGLLALAGFLGFFLEGGLNPYYLQLLIYIGINITLAMSLNLINGFTGQFSLGHAGFMSIGAYTMAYVSTHLTPGWEMAHPIFWVVLIVSGGVSALAGFLIGLPSLRLKGDYLAIVTLGFGEIVRVVIQNLEVLGGARGYTSIPRVTCFFDVFAAAILCCAVVFFLINSTYGKGFLAVRDDELAVQSVGISATRYKVTAFVISAFFAGVAGALYAGYITYITPGQFGFMKSFEVVVMVIVGGMGSIPGVVISTILLTLLPELLRAASQFRMVIYAMALVGLMLWRPQGLFGFSFKKRRVS